ncbi:MAG: metallophosphoesterase family protein [Chlorobiota bacterium]
MRRFVIGDVHGCIRTLEALLWKQLRLSTTDEVYFVGDYIDRGPDSKAVVDLIRHLQQAGYRVVPLRGNHEQLLLDAMASEEMFDLWLLNGAATTLRSFGIKHPRELSEEYRSFFATLPFFAVLDTVVIVHAGLNFHIPDPFADTEAMLWDRSVEADPSRLGGRRLIVGHTPLPLPLLRQSLSWNKVFIDGGCVYGHLSGYGYLCALELESWELFTQVNIEMCRSTV